jgi:hypothetical protein
MGSGKGAKSVSAGKQKAQPKPNKSAKRSDVKGTKGGNARNNKKEEEEDEEKDEDEDEVEEEEAVGGKKGTNRATPATTPANVKDKGGNMNARNIREQEEDDDEDEYEDEEEKEEEKEVVADREYTEAEKGVVRLFLEQKLQYPKHLAEVVTDNPWDEDWRDAFHSLVTTPKYNKNNPSRPTNTTAKCRLCGKKCSAFCTLCFQFGGPCADMVPTCPMCASQHYIDCHSNGSSSVKKSLRAGARIPKGNPLQQHPRELKSAVTYSRKK